MKGASESRDKSKGSVKVRRFNDCLSNCQFIKKTLLHIVTDTFFWHSGWLIKTLHYEFIPIWRYTPVFITVISSNFRTGSKRRTDPRKTSSNALQSRIHKWIFLSLPVFEQRTPGNVQSNLHLHLPIITGCRLCKQIYSSNKPTLPCFKLYYFFKPLRKDPR
jgi:hypothetical protein